MRCVPDCPDSGRSIIWCKAQPAELGTYGQKNEDQSSDETREERRHTATEWLLASHVITSVILFDPLVAARAALELVGALKRLQCGNLLVLSRVFVILTTGATLVPCAAVGEARLPAAASTCHDRFIVHPDVLLPRAAALMSAPPELGLGLDSLPQEEVVICAEDFRDCPCAHILITEPCAAA